MRRVLPILLAALALAAPAGASAATPLRASLESCSAATRTAVFAASMPAVRGARTMAVRFDLETRADADADWQRVAVPGLGVFKRSSAGQTGFVFTQRVQELAAPGTFRAVVHFRWHATGGRILKSTTRTTGTCTQPDPRPDLRAGVLGGTLSAGGGARYSLVVSNAGRSYAGAFGVQIAGVRAEVAGLVAGSETTVTVEAPRCAPGETVAIVLDPAGQVGEADESDDAVQRACPLS